MRGSSRSRGYPNVGRILELISSTCLSEAELSFDSSYAPLTARSSRFRPVERGLIDRHTQMMLMVLLGVLSLILILTIVLSITLISTIINLGEALMTALSAKTLLAHVY